MARYSKGEKIGDGSFSVVFKARDNVMDKYVAIKRISLNNRDGVRSEILREVSVLKALDHVNVIRLLDVEVTYVECNLIFEYMNYDLAKFIKDCPATLSDPLVIKRFLFQILQGVSYCHSLKVMHRDLKPHNLLVDLEKTIKLADFGFARTIDGPLERYSTDVTTLAYKAPELLLCLPYTSAIDIWSVGCTFGEMVTRETLFSENTESKVMERIVSLLGLPDESDWPEGVSAWGKIFHKKVPDVPARDLTRIFPGLDVKGIDLLKKMLCVNPHKRIIAAEALRHPYLEQFTK